MVYYFSFISALFLIPSVSKVYFDHKFDAFHLPTCIFDTETCNIAVSFTKIRSQVQPKTNHMEIASQRIFPDMFPGRMFVSFKACVVKSR